MVSESWETKLSAVVRGYMEKVTLGHFLSFLFFVCRLRSKWPKDPETSRKIAPLKNTKKKVRKKTAPCFFLTLP